MKRKIILTAITAMLLTVLLTTSLYASTTAIIVDGRTLMPARDAVEMLGGEVSWNGELRQVTAVYGDTNVLLTIDNPVAYVNGQAVELDVPPQIIDGSTKIPLRFIAEAFGIDVDFRDDTIFITSGQGIVEVPVVRQESPVVAPAPPPQPAPTPAPTQNVGRTVYWVQNGEVYHIRSSCPSLSRSRNIRSGANPPANRRRCQRC